MIREVISEDGKRRIKHIYKTDNVDEIKEHINNVLIEYIVQKVKENMWKILLFLKVVIILYHNLFILEEIIW